MGFSGEIFSDQKHGSQNAPQNVAEVSGNDPKIAGKSKSRLVKYFIIWPDFLLDFFFFTDSIPYPGSPGLT